MGKLIERLSASPVLCAEIYMFEFERRGYLSAGSFVPEVLLEHPEVVGTPEASRYSPDMSMHYALETNRKLRGQNRQFSNQL